MYMYSTAAVFPIVCTGHHHLHSHAHCTRILAALISTQSALASNPRCTRIHTALHSHPHFAYPPQHTPLSHGHPFMPHPAALVISPGLALSFLLLMMKDCPPLAMLITSKVLYPQAFPKPIQIRTWPGETDPNPNLARQNRSESEPGPAEPIRVRTWPGETDPNPNLARAKPIRIRTQENQSEPGAWLLDRQRTA